MSTSPAYCDQTSLMCMRKVVVFTNPTTGAQMSKYRAFPHTWVTYSTTSAETIDECSECGTVA